MVLGARSLVVAFLDIDPTKLQKGYHVNDHNKKKIPILPFKEARPPLLLCVSTARGGQFEQNLASLQLKEGVDYIHFS